MLAGHQINSWLGIRTLDDLAERKKCLGTQTQNERTEGWCRRFLGCSGRPCGSTRVSGRTRWVWRCGSRAFGRDRPRIGRLAFGRPTGLGCFLRALRRDLSRGRIRLRRCSVLVPVGAIGVKSTPVHHPKSAVLLVLWSRLAHHTPKSAVSDGNLINFFKKPCQFR